MPKQSEQHKRVSFLHGMVAADIFRFRNVKRDVQVISLSNKLREETGRDDGGFFTYYAQRIVYTDAMYFNWHEDAPIEFVSLETWWEMLQSGQSDVDCYIYYIENISNPVSNQWQDALDDAHSIWKPVEERTITTQGGNEPDPNS